MFTGIIEHIVKVNKLYYYKKKLFIEFYNPFYNKIRLGQSISHNGICLTVYNIFSYNYLVSVSEETICCTNIRFLKRKDLVNLERSLLINSRIDGHLVKGHVDTTANVFKIVKLNGSWLFYFKCKNILKYVIKKGSITVNGISLTIVSFEKYIFSVSIIPYTYINTNLHFLKVGNVVNIEFDIIGKYIEKFLKK
ncbi:riboflavin synthase [Blattabacterium cuenoti]|uniref:riboflavin synthase n=1 Tax=Blattabacterium cuenoti TaxID=1653831 RepID=UPI00163C49AD|nr:riboflavin synthase [Blattabacterium cuenoti]